MSRRSRQSDKMTLEAASGFRGGLFLVDNEGVGARPERRRRLFVKFPAGLDIVDKSVAVVVALHLFVHHEVDIAGFVRQQGCLPGSQGERGFFVRLEVIIEGGIEAESVAFRFAKPAFCLYVQPCIGLIFKMKC